MKNLSERLLEFNKGRVPAPLDYKYQCMRADLFNFYRATCHVFYEDLAKETDFPSGPDTWICGDLHLENFGSFKGENRLVYFDMNDFDDALMAPATWELVRMVTSIFVAFTSLNIGKEKAIHMAKLFLKSYTATLQSRKAHYIEAKTATGIVKDFLDIVASRNRKTILEKRTVNNKKIDSDHPKHITLSKTLRKELKQHLGNWLKRDDKSPYNYKILDVVFRLSGTSSLGLNRYSVLLKSINENGSKFMLLDMKEAVPSSLQPFAKNKQPVWINDAERVLFIQQLMQNHSPALLSTTHFKGKDYIMQELQPAKDNINFKLLKKQYRDMCLVIDNMGMLTAASQLRSAGHRGSDDAEELVVFGNKNNWQEPIINYAQNYSAVIENYYEQFKKDYKRGVFRQRSKRPKISAA